MQERKCGKIRERKVKFEREVKEIRIPPPCPVAVDLEWAWPIAGERKGENQGKVNLQRKGNTHCGKGKISGREWRGEKKGKEKG